MITSEQFSKDLLAVITFLIGMTIVTIGARMSLSFMSFENYELFFYLANLAPKLMFGIALCLRRKISILASVSVVSLCLFYPLFGGISYLFFLVKSYDEL